jgi:acyl-[acyl-carrier-protein]-phospholipid O-acyltransferase / long-chain-fatty-acid--[acyl-carrier-protein] ligase
MLNLLRVRGFAPFVAVVFLNAFVDLGHKIIVQNTIFKVYADDTQIALTAIVNALILLPFVLLFTPAGFCSDKFAKPHVMRIAAWIAVALTVLITVCYYQGWFWPALVMTFLLGAQATFYSPAKYGYIREVVGTAELTTANGLIQAVSTIAILAGIFVFSVLFENRLKGELATSSGAVLAHIAPIGWWLVAAAIVELILIYRLPSTPAAAPEQRFDWSRYTRLEYLRDNLKDVRADSIVYLSIIGLAIFWAIAQVVVAAFPALAKESLALTDTVTVQGLLACTGVGIAIGSVVAGRASIQHIETGLVPIGAFGVALTVALVPVLHSLALHRANFVAMGFLGGLFIVPLNALIQYHSAEHTRGTVLAASNFIQKVLMLAFLLLTVLFTSFGLPAKGLFLLLVVVGFGGALYTVYKLPQALVRIITHMVISQRYRMRVIGFDTIPEHGGVLLLGNHISWIDWAVLQIACPRPIRFVMERSIYERWYLKWFLNSFGVIPIGGSGSRTALDEVRESLNAGQVVGLFPEGAISRTGHLGEFKRGYEQAAQDANGVIVPFYLFGLWGSTFSRSSARLRALRGGGIRRDIVVAFGKPLSLATPAEQLKRRVFELSIESWERYTKTLDTIPEAWLATAKQVKGDMALADTVAGPMSGYRVITGVLIIAGFVKRYAHEQNVGLLLPTSNGGALANLAVLMRGKTVVNLNYTASPIAIQAAIAKAEIRTVFTSSRFLDRLKQRGIDAEAVLEGVRLYKLEDLGAGVSQARRIWTLLQAVVFPRRLIRLLYCKRVPLDSPAAILFSSGSEGEPKGVVLSHRNIMGNVKQISDVINAEESDVVMATLPQFHAFGLTATTFMPLIEGIPMVCHPDPTDAVNIGKAVATYRATILMGTSTFFRLYAKNTRVHHLMFESLRLVVAGAEKLATDVRETFKIKFGKEILEGYGATETTPVAGVNIPDRLDTTYWKVQFGNKPGTIGMPLPGSSFRIVDPNTLQELPIGEDGLILIGGTQVMLGYLGDPERTAKVIVEMDGLRWYKTGDKGHLDEDGFLTIVDRYSRFAKLGGEMVSLTAVEEQVRRIVGDPELEICAVNLPEPKKGEQIVLLVAGGETDLDALRKQLVDAGCNPLTVPSEYRRVEEVPKLGSGKTDFTAARVLAESVL